MQVSSILTVFLGLTLLISDTSARIRKQKEGKKEKSKMDRFNNLCTIEGNAMAFHCFCSDGAAPANATKAKCWAFNGLTRDHNVWNLFSTQPFIRELDIMVTPQTQINFIPTKGLQYLKELRQLTIMYAKIDDIHSYAFANLSKLQEMTLTRNLIQTLSHHAFAHLANLSIINLDENHISELNRDVFVDLPSLQKLFVKLNNISVVQEGAFRHLAHLLELDLSSNSLTVLTKDTFAGLGELLRLLLNNNSIGMLGDLTFAELWVLEELDLAENQIEFISDRAFAGLTHLRKLNLGFNKLKMISNHIMDSVPAIINLDLRGNNLETLTLDSVRPILHNFYNTTSYLYIDKNQFVCDCRLAWMHILRNETKNQLIKEVLDQLTCHLETDGNDVFVNPPINPPVDPYQPAVSMFSTKSEGGNLLQGNGKDLSDLDPDVDPLKANEDSEYYYEEVEEEYPQPANEKTSIRRLFQIPVPDLPCASEAPSSGTGDPRTPTNTPAYAEIYNASGASLCHVPLRVLVMVAIVFLVCGERW